jgi:hypothetical protein
MRVSLNAKGVAEQEPPSLPPLAAHFKFNSLDLMGNYGRVCSEASLGLALEHLRLLLEASQKLIKKTL